MWNFGQSRPAYGSYGVPPLRWWDTGIAEFDTRINADVTYLVTSPWQMSYMVLELGRAAEQGFPAAALFAWAAPNIIGQVTDRSRSGATWRVRL